MLSSSLESISSTCGNWAAAATVDPLEPPAWLVTVPLAVGGAERTLRERLGALVAPEDDSKVGDYSKRQWSRSELHKIKTNMRNHEMQVDDVNNRQYEVTYKWRNNVEVFNVEHILVVEYC